jgi:reverse transcriptase-like protein
MTHGHEPPLAPSVRSARVPKPGGGMRRITVLGAGDATTYARAVAAVTPAIERRLGPEIFANRAPGGTSLEPWRVARRRWARSAARLIDVGPVMTLDVVACYDSITARTIEYALERLRITGPAAEEIGRILRAFGDAGVPGIPIGPEPSAILANAVLAHVDEGLRADRVPFVRWVDDILVAATNERTLDRAERTVEQALAELGLRSNLAKRRRFDDRDAAAAFLFGPAAVRTGSCLRYSDR